MALKAREVKRASDSLYTYIQDLKIRIAKVADGENANVNSIEHKDDLEAASRVMLSPVSGEGKKLRAEIDKYRIWMGGFIEDSAKTAVLEANLSTTPLIKRDQYPYLGRGLVREYAGSGGCYPVNKNAK